MKALGVAVVLLAASTAAFAQEASRGDVFAGYSLLATDGAEAIRSMDGTPRWGGGSPAVSASCST